MTTARTLAHLDHTWSTAVTPVLRSAVRQLHSWTSGFPASTSDAPPDTQRHDARPPAHGDTEPAGDLTPPDVADRKLRRIHTLMARTVFEANVLGYHAGTEYVPAPARRFEAEAAYVQLHINRLVAGPLNRGPEVTKGIKHMVKLADELANICASARPADVRTKYTEACHAHTAGGFHAEIDAHNYAKHHLCRWCGDFRKVHGVNPPAALIRLHDRGIRITTTHLRNNGIRVA